MSCNVPSSSPAAAEPLEPRRHLAVDLQIPGDIVLDSQFVGEAQPFRGDFAIVNRGDAATAGPVTYRLVMRTDNPAGPGAPPVETVVGSGTTAGAVAPAPDGDDGRGKGGLVRFDFAVPASLIGKNGALVAIVDPADAIAETDESNNRDEHNSVYVARPLVDARFNGTAADDRVIVMLSGDAIVVFNQLFNDYRLALAADLPKLTIDLRPGADRVQVLDYTRITVPLEVFGGSGNDTVDGGAGDDTVHGADGDDVVAGNGGADSLLGDAGADRLDGGDDADFVGGGAGDDAIRGRGGDDALAGDAGDDDVRGDEGDDRVAGNAGSDNLRGGGGDDTLLGQGGRDFLRGGPGADSLIGGAGNDVLSVDAGDDGLDTLSGGAGRDEGYASAGALLASIEQRHDSNA